MREKVKLIGYILLIPILGALSSLFFEATNFYAEINTPFFAPPSWVFPVAWTILYGLLGAFLYNLVKSKNKKLIIVYMIQMVINLTWSYVFFNFKMFTVAYIMILLMIILTGYLICMTKNYKYTYLLVPYILWLIFASFLNLGIIILN